VHHPAEGFLDCDQPYASLSAPVVEPAPDGLSLVPYTDKDKSGMTVVSRVIVLHCHGVEHGMV